MHVITEVNSYDANVQVCDDGDPGAAASFQPTALSLANRTKNINTRLGTLEGQTLNTRLTTLEGENLNSRIGVIEGENLNTRLGTLEGQTLNTRLTTLEGENLNARLNTLEGQNLNARLNTLEAFGPSRAWGIYSLAAGTATLVAGKNMGGASFLGTAIECALSGLTLTNFGAVANCNGFGAFWSYQTPTSSLVLLSAFNASGVIDLSAATGTLLVTVFGS